VAFATDKSRSQRKFKVVTQQVLYLNNVRDVATLKKDISGREKASGVASEHHLIPCRKVGKPGPKSTRNRASIEARQLTAPTCAPTV